MRHRPLVASVAFACVCFAASAGELDNWTVFTDPTVTFQLSVPQTPKTVDDVTSESIPYRAFVIDRGGYAMMEMVADYAGRNVDPARVLDQAAEGAQKRNRTLVSNVSVTIDGHPGRDIVVGDAAGKLFHDRVFFFDNHLYQTITVLQHDATDEQKKAADRFTLSLHFLR